MNWKILNGNYPTNPIWGLPIWIVLAFEALVITVEILLGVLLWEKMKKRNEKIALITVVIVGNLVTFAMGAIIQGLL
jgi:hypothetical protein